MSLFDLLSVVVCARLVRADLNKAQGGEEATGDEC